jgi:hypothetical protein
MFIIICDPTNCLLLQLVFLGFTTCYQRNYINYHVQCIIYFIGVEYAIITTTIDNKKNKK